jgi:Tol biopolymer transport system component
MTRTIVGWLLAGAGAALLGCGESIQDPTPGPGDDSTGLVSNAVMNPGPGTPTGATVAYVHLPEGTALFGLAASIHNRNLGTTLLAYPAGGGFDPVPVSARPGDVLDLEVRGEGGVVLFRGETRVPASRRPRVVRTDPPPRKRDVPLNAAFIIIFSEPIAGNTLTPGSVRLVSGAGVVTGQISLEPDGLRAEFVPDRALEPNTVYDLVVTTDVTDLAGEPLEPADVEFTTGTALEPVGLGRLAFGTCLDDDRCGIFVVNADGSNVRQLTDPSSSRNLDPAWSPDGRKIAFSGFQHCVFDAPGSRCLSEIFVMNTDGSGVTRLTNGSDNSSFLPTWSPDGRRIAFQSTTFGSFGGGSNAVDIFAMDADGSNVVRLTDDPGFALGPKWSPDGSRIAFSSTRDGDEELYVMNADGSNPRRLTHNPGLDQQPTWSPDGTRIAFTSDRDADPQIDGRDIYVMNAADGQGLVRLTNDPAYDAGPAWSPDGLRIAFASGRDGSGLFVMNADGSGVVRIRAGFAGPPSWSPIGTAPPPVARTGRFIRP